MKRKIAVVFLLCLGLTCLLFAGSWYLNNWSDEKEGEDGAKEAADALKALGISPDLVDMADAAENTQEQSHALSRQSLGGSDAADAFGVDNNAGDALTGNQPQKKENTNAAAAPIVIDGTEYLGLLYFPKLSLSLAVFNECTDANLKRSPCRFSGSLNDGSLVIAGHNYRAHFSRLRTSLKPGDRVCFIDSEKNLHDFTVSATETLAPDETERMCVTDGSWDMTLFTCTLGGGNRFTFRCKKTE